MDPYDNLDDPEFIHPALRGRFSGNISNELPSGPSAKVIRMNQPQDSLFGDEDDMPALESIPSNPDQIDPIGEKQADDSGKDKIDLDIKLPQFNSSYQSNEPAQKPKKLSLFAQRRLQKQQQSSGQDSSSRISSNIEKRPVIGDIVDHPTSSQNNENPILIQPGGFPEVTRDFISSENKALPSYKTEPTGVSLRENDLDDAMRQSIGQENDQKLASMSPEEIQQQLQALFQGVKPETLKVLERMRARQNPNIPNQEIENSSKKSSENSKKVTFNIQNDQPKRERQDTDYIKYFQGVPIEHDKLEWMNNLNSECQKEQDSLQDTRFNLQGLPISDSKLTDDSYLSGLHHHGDKSHLPGYTIKELLTLSRSTNLSQSCLALDILSKIIYNCQKGSYQQWEQIKSLILNEGVTLFMRGTLGMGNRSSTTYAIKGIAESIVNLDLMQFEDQLLQYGYTQPLFSSQFGTSGYSDVQNQINTIKNDPDSDINKLGQLDTVMYLVNIDILGSISHMLKEYALPKNSLDHILLILNSIGSHSKSLAKEIADSKGLLSTIKKRFLTDPAFIFKQVKEDEELDDFDMVDPYDYELPPNALAFRLIKVLAISNGDIAQDIFSSQMLPTISPPPSASDNRLEAYFAIVNEMIGIWKVLSLNDRIQSWSQFRSEGLPNIRRFFGLDASEIINKLVCKNQTKLTNLSNTLSNWFNFLSLISNHSHPEWQDVLITNSALLEYYNFGLLLYQELLEKSEHENGLLLSNASQFINIYRVKFSTQDQTNTELFVKKLASDLAKTQAHFSSISTQLKDNLSIAKLNEWTNLKSRQLGPYILPPDFTNLFDITGKLLFGELASSTQLISLLSLTAPAAIDNNLIDTINAIALDLVKLPYSYFKCFSSYTSPLLDFLHSWITISFEKLAPQLSTTQISTGYLLLVQSFNIPSLHSAKKLKNFAQTLFSSLTIEKVFEGDKSDLVDITRALPTIYSNIDLQPSQYHWIFTPMSILWNLNPSNDNQLDKFEDLFNNEDIVKTMELIFNYYLKLRVLDHKLGANVFDSHLDYISIMQYVSLVKLLPEFNILSPGFLNPIQEIFNIPFPSPIPYTEDHFILKPSEIYRGFLDIYKELAYKDSILAQLLIVPLHPQLKLERIVELFWTQVNEEVDFFPWQLNLIQNISNQWESYCNFDPATENAVIKNAKLKLCHRYPDLDEKWKNFSKI